MDKIIKIVGLTGGIGTGKSTAAEYLKKKGFAHIDADRIARDLTADGNPMVEKLNEIFGPGGKFGKNGHAILNDDRSLNRKALAEIIFTDMKKKHKLDEIMFEAIIDKIEKEIKLYKQKDYIGIMIDAPLLFEAGLNKKCDMILLITAETDIRIHRVCQRDGMAETEVRNRINSQLDEKDLVEKSDYIIDNSGTEKEFYESLENFFVKFSKNS